MNWDSAFGDFSIIMITTGVFIVITLILAKIKGEI